jgi:hypothetical protein
MLVVLLGSTTENELSSAPVMSGGSASKLLNPKGRQMHTTGGQGGERRRISTNVYTNIYQLHHVEDRFVRGFDRYLQECTNN